MKHIIKYLILLTFIVTFPARGDGPARWQVKDSDTTLHLFGTIHALKANIKWQNKAMLEEFDKSSHVIFELAPAQLSWMVMQTQIKSRGLFGPNDSLKNYLDAETFSLVFKELRARKMPAHMIAKIKPWFAAMILSSAPNSEDSADTFNRKYGVETILTTRAHRQGKNMGGLESAAGQINVFAGLKMDEQVIYLKTMLEAENDETGKADEMLNAWVNGDVEQLDGLVSTDLKEFPSLFYRLLPKRNKNWVRQIHIFMEYPGDIFIAVGAGHMMGEEGLINLLKKAGYAVERIN